MTTHRRSDAEHEKGGWQEPPKKRVRRSLEQSTCRQESGESEESGSSASTPAGGAGGGAGAAAACTPTHAHSSQVKAAQEQPCVATAKCSAAVQTSSAACESSTASSCAGRGTAAAATGRVQDHKTCTTTATSATAATTTATHTASPTATNTAATTAIGSLHGSSCATAPTICVQLMPVSSATHYTDAKSIASAAMPLAIPKRVWMCARKEPSASYSRIGKYAWAFAIKNPCARAVLTR